MADFMYRGDTTKKLEKMCNAQKFSDTLFLVNNSKFHASSHLVSASSDVLDSLLDTHYQNCDDREITMGGIKNDESFLVILKCIYGIELNLTQMSKAVMCEVLCLCEKYELTDFSNAIKHFLATLECVQLDSLVILLNTAKKFSIKELYERLTVFAYENADQLVKHKSFAELQFDVLKDLLKSNSFYASEMDILTATLIWHSENMNQSPSNVGEILDMKNDIASVAEDSDAGGGETDQIQTIDTKKRQKKRNRKNEKNALNKSAESPSTGSKVNNLNVETTNPDQTDSCAQLVKTFSENVLKTLLSHIRMKQISVFEFMHVFDTELFSRYKLFLTGTAGVRYFSEINEPRVKYEHMHNISKQYTDQTETIDSKTCDKNVNEPSVKHVQVAVASSSLHDITKQYTDHTETIESKSCGKNVKEASVKHVQVAVASSLHDITKEFTVKIFNNHFIYESEEEYLIGDMKFKLCCQYHPYCFMTMYLKCSSDKQSDWECTTECHFTLSSCQPFSDSLVLPYKSVSLTSDNSCVQVYQYSGNIFSKFCESRKGSFSTLTFEVHFKSIHVKTK